MGFAYVTRGSMAGRFIEMSDEDIASATTDEWAVDALNTSRFDYPVPIVGVNEAADAWFRSVDVPPDDGNGDGGQPEPLTVSDPGPQSVPASSPAGTVVCTFDVSGGTPPYSGTLQQDGNGQFELDGLDLVTKAGLATGSENVAGVIGDSAGQNVNRNVQINITAA